MAEFRDVLTVSVREDGEIVVFPSAEFGAEDAPTLRAVAVAVAIAAVGGAISDHDRILTRVEQGV